MKYTIFFLILCALSFGCVKDKNQEYTISGRILKNCSGEPYADCNIKLVQLISTDWLLQTSGGEVATTVTDSLGYFTFTYKPRNDAELKMSAAGAGYSGLLDYIPAKKNIQDLVLYDNASTTVQVTLNVVNSYSVNDTLFITDFGNFTSWLQVPGPFTSGILYAAGYSFIFNRYDAAGIYAYSPYVLRYKINSGAWTTKDLQYAICDTTKVTVDID